MILRAAAPGDAEALSALALRSKAHWGYPPAFLEACREALTLTEADVTRQPTFLVEDAGDLLGFASLAPGGEDVDLAFLFVEPAAIGQGVGQRLWAHAVALARAAGFQRLTIESDPHAEGFYLAMGAVRIGEAPGVGRALPFLAYRL